MMDNRSPELRSKTMAAVRQKDTGHDCFWHGCAKGKLPKSRLEYWGPKIESNIDRDKSRLQQLKELGWKSYVVWQCELADESTLKSNLVSFLEGRIDPEVTA